jgi:hydrogenase maturation protein HypF
MRKATVRISGVVQGVGFRPFLVRLAREYGVTGFVKNECGYVFVEAYAQENTLLRFLEAIREHAPVASRILRQEQEIHDLPDAEERPAYFRILLSESRCGGIITPSPDIATCDDCLRELFSPDNPRYRNPFISCTNCGPRYSILHDIPYDRANTSMDIYPLCPFCAQEYSAPSNRRFHAQTVCCNDCGPILDYFDRAGNARGDKALPEAIRALRGGHIVAVKGIGGYHFACNPYNDEAVAALRALKGRERKPFAVMFRDIEDIWAHCIISPEEEALLASPARPIVLLLRTLDSLSPLVCGKSPYLGVFLPYTPLQHLLLQETGPLVMTSANSTSLPIIMDDWAIMRFFSEHNGLHGVLCHDRGILRRLDDSVAMVARGNTHILRRARGYVPLPLPCPSGGVELIACGSQEKNTVCLYKDGLLYPSGEIGDLDSMETLRAYRRTVKDMRDTLRIAPELVVCDMHPGYESSRYAKSMCVPVMEAQHHHAHIASVMAEHGLSGSVIGVAFDGTGYGTDSTVWGGEFLIVSPAGFTRAAHLKPVRLLGSDNSVRQGWKTALCMLYDAGGDIPSEDDRAQLVLAALQKDIHTIRSSSMGRVFDAVSALLGICEESGYNGQCAIELEYAAMRYLLNDGQAEPLPYSLAEMDETVVIDFAPCFRELQARISQGDDAKLLALRFHRTICHMIADVCAILRNRYGVGDVALSGGVFQNRILLEETMPLLESSGFTVYTNSQVPAGDGGLSLGQAYIGLMKNQ